MIAAAVLGSWFGAGIVSGWPRRNIQIGMGCALLVAATLFLFTIFDIAPGGGDALALTGARLAIGVGVNFLLGRAHGGGRRALRPVHDPGRSARHEPAGGLPDHDGLVRVPDADRQPEVHPQRALQPAREPGPRPGRRARGADRGLHREGDAALLPALAGGRGGAVRGAVDAALGHRRVAQPGAPASAWRAAPLSASGAPTPRRAAGPAP